MGSPKDEAKRDSNQSPQRQLDVAYLRPGVGRCMQLRSVGSFIYLLIGIIVLEKEKLKDGIYLFYKDSSSPNHKTFHFLKHQGTK